MIFFKKGPNLKYKKKKKKNRVGGGMLELVKFFYKESK